MVETRNSKKIIKIIRITEIMKSPNFNFVRVNGRKGKPTILDGDSDGKRVINIIPKDEILDNIKNFGHQVLRPIIQNTNATFVPILNGAMPFYVALSHTVDDSSNVEVMPVQASSYGKETTSEKVRVSHDLIIPEKIKGRTLILVDDILETGKTISEVKRLVEVHDPARVITVFLLRKDRGEVLDFRPDYWLFDINPSSWVFGFGMDLEEKYRHLRYICDDRLSLYKSDGSPNY
jgi:hypoxanthine phosphoribosyltransferase